MSKQVEAFKPSVSVADIADLRDRPQRTRFADQAPGPVRAYDVDAAWRRGRGLLRDVRLPMYL
jgi:hypothetical protein